MKARFLFLIIAVFAMMITCRAQETATEAGEDFDLYAAISLFENAEDLEDFEKKLNSEENDVNNLDLNNDDEVDMVRIVEYSEGNTKVLVIQAVIGEDDYQDIATIELEKFGENEISGQIIGDEEIYGPDYFIEPSEETASLNSSYSMAVYVSVHLWRPVRGIYRPGRVLFVSAITVRSHPVWFRARRPIARSAYRSRAARWHSPRFRATKARHSPRGKSMYSSKRRTSTTAKKHYGHKSTQQNKQQQNKQQQSKQQQQKKQQQPNKQQQQKKQQQPKRR
jgi:hypothetical protein